MVTFSLKKIPEETWKQWKNTVPRTVSLEDALIQLIEEELKRQTAQKMNSLKDHEET